jgi:hypothetical protein
LGLIPRLNEKSGGEGVDTAKTFEVGSQQNLFGSGNYIGEIVSKCPRFTPKAPSTANSSALWIPIYIRSIWPDSSGNFSFSEYISSIASAIQQK